MTITNQGSFGCVEDQKGEIIEYLQSTIKTVADFWLYLCLTKYSYFEDEQGYMSSPVQGWNMQNDARINILDNCGVCCETAMVLNYLLEGDYEKTGFITVHSSLGHQYAYVKGKGTYYFLNFTGFTSGGKQLAFDISRVCENYLMDGNDNPKFIKENVFPAYDDWKDKICFWSGKSLDDPSATKAVLIHDTYCEGKERRELSWEYTYNNTDVIWAERYYAGMKGSTVSFLMDDGMAGALYRFQGYS